MITRDKNSICRTPFNILDFLMTALGSKHILCEHNINPFSLSSAIMKIPNMSTYTYIYVTIYVDIHMYIYTDTPMRPLFE